jgi:hypothetical protein
MLEDFAISFTNQSEATLMAWGIGLSLLGFALALRMRRNSQWSLQRVPYFLAFAGIFVLSSALSLAWMATFEAMKHGVLWLLVASIFLGIAAFGYVYGVISHARSVSGYGDGGSAWMAFVPIANLFLLFKAPIQKDETKSAARMAGNFVEVVLGLFLLALAQGITKASDDVLDNMIERAGADAELQSISTEAILRAQGLETTLSQMAAEVPSQQVDDTTTLLRVEARATTLRYVYRVDTNAQNLPTSVRRGLTEHNCTYEALAPVIQAGATIEHFYGRPDGTELGTVTINQAICDNPEPEVPAKPTEAEIMAMVEASPAGEMYRALKGYYPEEAKYFRDRMMALLSGGADEEEAFSKMLTVGAEIRRRHAANLRTAPDQSLLAILQSQTQMIAAFDDDPVLCNRVVMFGAGSIPEDQRHRIVALMDSAGLLFRAMYEGEQSPVQRAQATDDDWGSLIVNFYAAGGTDDELDLIMQPDIQNPQLCGAMLRFLRVLTDANFSGSDRLRAEMVAAMNEG